MPFKLEKKLSSSTFACMRYLLLAMTVYACSSPNREIDIQGHRGARGLMPENTIPAFLYAVDLGVTTLELDLVVSKDGELVVSHEPYFSHEMCADSIGQRIASDTLYNIYQMTYEEVSQFDCGSLEHPRFPNQQKMKIGKPLFKDMISAVEDHLVKNRLPKVNYNIELKTNAATDNIYHPTPEEFSELVYEEVSVLKIWNRVNIQSFDFRTLQYFRQKYPNVKLALLIENELRWEQNTDSLGFVPDIYSCYYELLSQEIVKNLQKEGLAVIPWTVNNTKDMEQLIEWGVDGIITDYPDRTVELLK